MSDDFDRKLAKEQQAGRKARLEDDPPIGMGPDGKIVIFKPGDRPDLEPQVIGAGESEDLDDVSDLDDED